VYVSSNLNDETLWRTELLLGVPHWIGEQPVADGEKRYQVRLRHRAALIEATFVQGGDDLRVRLHNAERAITAGQSVVVYDGEYVLGGGIVIS
jgi:tRNA-specific 2-thiouridylase